MGNTFVVRNLEQAILFMNEIRGQLSDGAWENSRPYDHWKCWSRATVKIGSNVGIDFWPDKDNYNLTNSSLLKIIGPRMIGAVKLAKAGYLKLKDAGNYEGAEAYSDVGCGFDSWDMPTEQSIDANYKEWVKRGQKDKYWREKAEGVDKIFGGIDKLKKIILSNSYDKNQLIKDLKELKIAMKTRL